MSNWIHRNDEGVTFIPHTSPETLSNGIYAKVLSGEMNRWDALNDISELAEQLLDILDEGGIVFESDGNGSFRIADPRDYYEVISSLFSRYTTPVTGHSNMTVN